MKCAKCTNEATIKYPNGDLCNSCFMDMLYKRVEKELRQHPFKKGESVLIVGELASHFIDHVNKIELFKVFAEESNENEDYDKIVIPWTADDEADNFYEELTSNKPNLKENNKTIKLFKSILDKELAEAAKILKIEFTPKKRNSDVEKINKKYPTAKFGLVKSSEEIKKALK